MSVIVPDSKSELVNVYEWVKRDWPVLVFVFTISGVFGEVIAGKGSINTIEVEIVKSRIQMRVVWPIDKSLLYLPFWTSHREKTRPLTAGPRSARKSLPSN